MKLQMIVTAVIVVSLLAAGAWLYRQGFDIGQAKVERQNVIATEDQADERNTTNETIRNADDARKCELIGGVFNDGTCG